MAHSSKMFNFLVLLISVGFFWDIVERSIHAIILSSVVEIPDIFVEIVVCECVYTF